jgi:fatty acid desaturase
MTTKQLAVYLVTFIAFVAIQFGMVPPMLNSTSSFVVALGIAVVLATLISFILIFHATYTRSWTAGDDHQRSDVKQQQKK